MVVKWRLCEQVIEAHYARAAAQQSAVEARTEAASAGTYYLLQRLVMVRYLRPCTAHAGTPCRWIVWISFRGDSRECHYLGAITDPTPL
jgi:hypothetical protein